MEQKLFTRNFTFLILGQFLSILANSMLHFSISLYILDVTGSATIFATITAISSIPMIICFPIGGIVTDRLNRKYIMIFLDVSTALVTALFATLLPIAKPVLLVLVAKILLSIFAVFESPTVTACLPTIVPESQLGKANAATAMVDSTSNIIGPILGGILYGIVGVRFVVYLTLLGFLAAATVELFLKIPYERKERTRSMVQMVKGDILESVFYLKKEQPMLMKLVVIICTFNIFISSLINVGLPFMINNSLNLESKFYGFAEGIFAFGTILGGVIVGMIIHKMKIENLYKLLLSFCITLLPIAIALKFSNQKMLNYVVIVACVSLMGFSATLLNVAYKTYLQTHIPNHLLGKILSLTVMISFLSNPIGQSLYGVLFDSFKNQLHWVITIGIIGGLFTSFIAKKTFSSHRI